MAIVLPRISWVNAEILTACFILCVVSGASVMKYVCHFVIPRCVCLTMTPGNNLGAEGVASLAPALEHLSQLTKLNLDGA